MEAKEIKAINFNVVNVKLTGLFMPVEIDEFLNGESDFKDNPAYVNDITLNILGYDENYDEYLIGSINGRYIDINEMILNEEFIEGYLDNEEPDILEFYCIAKDKEYIGHKNNIFSIDSIKLEEEFKDNKLLSAVIMMLEQFLKVSINKEVGAFIIDYKVSWHTDNEENLSIAFWGALGFRNSGFENTMYFNTDFDMREVYLLEKIKDYSYKNMSILALPDNISIFTYYNNKRIDGLKLNFDMVTKEELFMMYLIEGKSDTEIAKLFSTTAAKVKSIRIKHYITEENLMEKPQELIQTIINCIKKFDY